MLGKAIQFDQCFLQGPDGVGPVIESQQNSLGALGQHIFYRRSIRTSMGATYLCFCLPAKAELQFILCMFIASQGGRHTGSCSFEQHSKHPAGFPNPWRSRQKSQAAWPERNASKSTEEPVGIGDPCGSNTCHDQIVMYE